MLKPSRLTALLIAGAILSAPVLAADKGKAVATVNGQAVPQNIFDALLEGQKAQGAPDTPEMRNNIKEGLIGQEILLQEAKKKGIDKKPEVQTQLELAKRELIIRAFLSDYVRANPVSDDRLKAEYEGIKANLGSTEYKSRHILVEKEDEAKAIIAKLDKGEKLADLAKQSKDPGSRDKGGELGWSSPAAFVKPFGEAMSQLKKGEYTKTPVATQFGFHIIQLDDSRAATPPTFEQIKPQLQERAAKMKIEQLVQNLRSKAKVGN